MRKFFRCCLIVLCLQSLAQLKAALMEKTAALWGQTPLEDDVSFVCLQVS